MRVLCFDGCNQDMLEPAHASSDSEAVFDKRIVECLPSTAVDAVMSEASFPCHSNVAAIVGHDCASNGPLIYKIVRRDLDVVPQRNIGRYCGQIGQLVAAINHEAGARLHQGAGHIGRRKTSRHGTASHLKHKQTVVMVPQKQELCAATNPEGVFDAEQPRFLVRFGQGPVGGEACGPRLPVDAPHGPPLFIAGKKAISVRGECQDCQVTSARRVRPELVGKRNVALVVLCRVDVYLSVGAADCEERKASVDGSLDCEVCMGCGEVEGVAAEQPGGGGWRQALDGVGVAVGGDPDGQVHGAIVDHVDDGEAVGQPRHAAQQLGARLGAGAVGSPSDALQGGRLGGGDDQLVVEGQGAGDAGVDADDHAELEAGLLDAAGLARPRVLAMVPGNAEGAGSALAA